MAMAATSPRPLAPGGTRSAAYGASTHPMRDHLSLPVGWSAKHDWPVVVVIPDAGREFTANLMAFASGPGKRPYILVAPEVLTCGGSRTRTPDHYSYSRGVWDSLQGRDDFAFAELHAGLVPAYWATPRGAESRSWGGRVGCVREAAAPTRYGGDILPQT